MKATVDRITNNTNNNIKPHPVYQAYSMREMIRQTTQWDFEGTGRTTKHYEKNKYTY